MPREVLPGKPTPVAIVVDTPPLNSEGHRKGGRGYKIITKHSHLDTSPPYVDRSHPLIPNLPPNIGKLAESLAARADTIVFFIHSRSSGGIQS